MISAVVVACWSLVASLLVALPLTPQVAHAAGTPGAVRHGVGHAVAGAVGEGPGQPSQLVASLNGDIAALRTATTQTFPLADGALQEDLFTTPVNYQAADKSWQPINTVLTAVGATAEATTAGDVVSTLPNDIGSGPVTITGGGHTVGFGLVGASGVGAVSGATETWVGAWPGVDLALTDTDRGVKEALTLHSVAATAAFTSILTVPAGAIPALNGAGGVDISQDGAVIASIPPAFADDASGTPAGHTAVVPYAVAQVSATSWTLTMTVDPTWLTDPARVWPVVVDPTVYLAYGTGDLACGIVSSSATTAHCPDTTFGIGTNSGTYRALAKWPELTTTVPLDANILEADFYPEATSALNGTSQSVQVWELTRDWTSAATWNTYDGTHAWTTAGGDVTTYPSGTATLAATSGVRDVIPMTNLVTNWVNGSKTQHGIMIRATSEPAANLDHFASSSASTNAPELRVIYLQHVGSVGPYSFTSRPVDDRQTMSVNNANGNLVIDATDLALSSVGIGTTIARSYNSGRATNTSTLGEGWTFDTGRDVHAEVDPAGNIEYFAPGADRYSFYPTGTGYTDAQGANASASLSGGQVTLTFHKTSEVDVFNTDGTLHTRTDRNGNVQTFAYSGTFSGDGLPYLNSMTDTQGRSITFAHPVYYVTSVADPSGRAPSFAYTGNLMTSATDGNAKTTSYGYDSSSRLTTVTDPRGNAYTVGYDSMNRVTSLADPGGSCSTPVSLCTTFAYTAITTPGGTGTTVVTDPLGHATTYTWDNDDRITKVVDALGHSRATTWTANSDQATLTDSLSAVTTMGHDALNNPTTTQAPDVTGGGVGSGRTATLGYPTASGSGPYPGSDYQPTSSSDTEGNNPTTMAYDTTGNLTTVTPPSGSGGIALTSAYQGDTGVTSCGGHNGQLCKTTDGDGNATTFAYNTAYQLTSVTRPAPLGTTSITYDTLGRVATSTDAKAQKTTYSYDGDDRVTEVQLGGITTCTTADINAGNCQTFGYDNDGNLQTRVDATGTTSYGYTARDQVNSKTIPGQTTNSTTSYDAAGNVVSYADAGGTVSYVYDPANQLWALSEPGGSCPGYSATTPVTIPNTTKCTAFMLDNNGNRTKIAYPSGETVSYTLDSNGRATTITAYHNGSATAFFNRTLSYTTTVGSHDRSLLQTSVDGVGTTVTSTYSYDVYNRLTSDAVGATTYGYSYDQAGNRLTATQTSVAEQYYGYNNANQLCWSGTTTGTNGTTTCPTTPTGDTAYTYDANGNQTTGGSSGTASYDNQDQTTQNVVAGTTTTLAYAGGGQTERTTVGTTTIINGLEGVAGQTNGTSTYYTRDPNGNLISMRQGAGGTSTNSYYLLDQEASVLRLTAADGTTDVATYTYDPYGTTLTATGTLSTTNPYRYATSYYDTATGLSKLGARYYNPTLGRFTQLDTAGTGYVYAANDPSNETDPSGMLPSAEALEADAANVFALVGLVIPDEVIAEIGFNILEAAADTVLDCLFGCDGGIIHTAIKNVLIGILNGISFHVLAAKFDAPGQLTTEKIAEYLTDQIELALG